MKKKEFIIHALRLPLDALLASLGFLAGFPLRLAHSPLAPEQWLEAERAGTWAMLFIPILLLYFGLFGHYRFQAQGGLYKQSLRLLVVAYLWTLSVMSTFFIFKESFYSRLGFFYSLILSLLFVWFGRVALHLYYRHCEKTGKLQKKIALLGAMDSLKSRLIGENFVGVGKAEEADLHALKQAGVEEIWVNPSSLEPATQERILHFCLNHHLGYAYIPSLIDIEQHTSEALVIEGVTVFKIKATPLDAWGRIVKRALDIFLSSLALVGLSPLFALIALGIKLDSKGPVLFCKLDDGSPAQRIGQNGKPFTFYKFRTMIPNSHKLRYTELAHMDHREGPVKKIKKDPRITRFGAFLRRTSLDELPQLWNILKGDMSLVGPRPHLPEEVAQYQDHHRFLLTIKPGLTGMAQISGRSDLAFEDEVRLDTGYIRDWTLALDLKIILKTIPVVLFGKAAD